MDLCYKTFISVGNAKQHFSRLLHEVEKIIDSLPRPILIQSGHTPFQSTNGKVVDFIGMEDFTKIVNNAEILIFHAGAGSVLNAIRANKYPILVPRRATYYEHVNDHQVAFAKMVQLEQKAIMAENAIEIKNAITKIQARSLITTNLEQSRACAVIKDLLTTLFHQT